MWEISTHIHVEELKILITIIGIFCNRGFEHVKSDNSWNERISITLKSLNNHNKFLCFLSGKVFHFKIGISIIHETHRKRNVHEYVTFWFFNYFAFFNLFVFLNCLHEICAVFHHVFSVETFNFLSISPKDTSVCHCFSHNVHLDAQFVGLSYLCISEIFVIDIFSCKLLELIFIWEIDKSSRDIIFLSVRDIHT